MSKPSIPQGTRDFSPAEVRRRQHILNALKNIFEKYGFEPIETPSMENLSTLTGKYGEEGDRLIFKILNNGLNVQPEDQKAAKLSEFKKILNFEEFSTLNRAYSSAEITERALRYDLTIPFARYVVMHQNDIAFPFRRYQMQPVWRADRPQKGRYREFWQCDADIIGSTSLINEAELISIYHDAFQEFAIPVIIKINSRKVLAGIADLCGVPEQLTEMTVALDKLDKIGWDGVFNELQSRNIPVEKFHIIREIVENTESRNQTDSIRLLKDFFTGSATGLKGIEEIETTLRHYHNLGNHQSNACSVGIDITLARGLNYYTGIIAEVVCNHADIKMGSLGGGGRYDDLTGLFGLKGVSGVGVSFGIDRIYDVMEELKLFPDEYRTGTRVLIINFGEESEAYSLNLLHKLRNAGVSTEFYPDSTKFDKQMKYSNKRGIPFVVMPGEEERKQNLVSLKNLNSGTQVMVTVDEAIAMVSSS